MRHTFAVDVEFDIRGIPLFYVHDKDINAEDLLCEVQAAMALMDALNSREFASPSEHQ